MQPNEINSKQPGGDLTSQQPKTGITSKPTNENNRTGKDEGGWDKEPERKQEDPEKTSEETRKKIHTEEGDKE